MKTTNLQVLRAAFEVNKVLTMEEMCALSNGAVMRSVIRYLNELGYITSYNNKGMYYTLKNIPEFNCYGLWGYKKALFSINGSLKNTICVLVTESMAGMTGDELSSIIKINTRNSLTELSASNMVVREKAMGVYVYYATGANISQRQREKRRTNIISIERETTVDPNDTVEVLISYIKGIRTPEKISAHLRYKGINVDVKKVTAIFMRYDLEQDHNNKKKPV